METNRCDLYSFRMYRLRVDREFPAAHSITICGEAEEIHGHHFRVGVVVEGPSLDGEELLCDFHDLEARLDRAIDPFRNRTVNGVPPFDRVNPTAEALARHFGEAMASGLPEGVHLVEVAVGEAPGCTAIYRPERKESGR
jgi:6-pyruvoyltetrahydropterin/6-carboxytetrahydropterin synthase